MIQVKNLRKNFSDLEVLKGVNVTIEDGSVVGIIGASGSGKSTLLRCMDYLEKPDSGTIIFDDVSFDVQKATKADIRYLTSHITMVFQSFNLFKYKTALENVMEGLVIVQKKSKEEARDIAKHYLDQVGLLNWADHYPNQLSGGQQQRVAIARALAGNPSLILADEPTGNLDSKTGADVMQLFHELHQAGNTIVLITHDAKIAAQTPRSIHIHDGKVLEPMNESEVVI